MKKAVLLFLLSFSALFAFEELSAKNFDEKIKGKNAIIDFYSPSWGACKVLGKNIAKYSKNKPQNVEIYKVNILKETQLVKKHDVYGTPTLVYFKNQKEVGRAMGVSSAKDIEKRVKKHFNP